jgi:hypothetical protein
LAAPQKHLLQQDDDWMICDVPAVLLPFFSSSGIRTLLELLVVASEEP